MSLPSEFTPDTQRTLIGKAALALELGWSRPKLDRRLEADKEFPVVTRGTQAGGWEFDLEEVLTYIAANDKSEMTPRARRETAQAIAQEDKTRKDRGELVERALFEEDLALTFAELGKALDALPGRIVQALGIPEDGIPIIQDLIDEARRAAVLSNEEYLPDADDAG